MRPIVILTLIAMIALPAMAQETVRWIPAAASNEGQGDTQWQTDMWLFNHASDQPITVDVAFFGDNGFVDDASIEVPAAHGVLEIKDAIADLFEASQPGALRLRSDHPFEARSRTYNNGGGEGTFGQGIPSVAASTAFAPTGYGVLLGAANDPSPDGIRTNVGLVNTGDQAVTVRLWLYSFEADKTGADPIQLPITLPPKTWTQQNVFQLAGIDSEVIDLAYVLVEPKFNSVLFYLSRIDNRSGDAVYVQPIQWLADYSVAPGTTDIELSVDAKQGLVVNWITYSTSTMSESFVEPDTATIWQSTETIPDNEVFCYTVSGHTPAGAQGGITIQVRRDGEVLDTTTASSGSSQIYFFEDCLDLRNLASGSS